MPHQILDGYHSPEFSYRVLDGTGIGSGVVGAIGLNQTYGTPLPETCMAYTIMVGPIGVLSFSTRQQLNATDTDGLVFGSVGEATAYKDTADYQTLKRVFMSLTLDQ